jgi:hypothetical protein
MQQQKYEALHDNPQAQQANATDLQTAATLM